MLPLREGVDLTVAGKSLQLRMKVDLRRLPTRAYNQPFLWVVEVVTMVLIKSVRPLEQYRVLLEFNTGEQKTVDLLHCCAARCSSRFGIAARCSELCGLMMNSARLCGPTARIWTPTSCTARMRLRGWKQSECWQRRTSGLSRKMQAGDAPDGHLRPNSFILAHSLPSAICRRDIHHPFRRILQRQTLPRRVDAHLPEPRCFQHLRHLLDGVSLIR